MRDVTDFFAREGDYPDLDMEAALRRLSAAIQCRTVNDGRDYGAFEQLQALMRCSYPALLAAGEMEIIGHSVLITLPGSDKTLRGALFMSHQDVVPVVAGTEGSWTHPPFSGALADGFIWGRGTLDIKQQVFGLLEAAEYLLTHGAVFRRTVYLAFGEDEETFNTGAAAIAATLAARGVTLEFVHDEGGGAVTEGGAYGAPGIFVSPVELAEKGYADLELRVESAGGHSSRPFGGTSLGILAQAIARIVEAPFPAALSPVVRGMFAALAAHITQEPLRTLAGDLAGNAGAVADYCLTQPALFPLVTTTIAPTVIRGGSDACNVLPQDMSAVINFRLAEGCTTGEVLAHCRSAVGDERVKLRFLQANDPSAAARTDGLGYAALTGAMRRYYEGIVFIPAITAGATDACKYEPICDTCLRCSPFLANEEERRGVHGTDERLSFRAYAQGIRVLIALLRETCE